MGIDFDKWAVETYERNFGDHGVCRDIRKIRKFPGAEVVIGGPPCQGFSQLGSHIPNDPRNQLWRHYFRVIKQVRPVVFVMENVPQLLKSAEFARFLQRYRVLLPAWFLDAATPALRAHAQATGAEPGEG